jgi:DNA gyrase subunit A
LDLRLQKLTGLEQEKIIQEFAEILEKIAELLAILSDPDCLMQVIKDELAAIKAQFGDPRRTEIIQNKQDLTLEDMITEEDVVVTLSHQGYAKSQPLAIYQAQRRGGKGKTATATKEEDFVDQLFIANTHDTILCFSSRGKCYWLKVYELPQAGRAARGRPMVNLLPLEEGERINAVLPIREYTEDKYIFMATAAGNVKKTSLVDFSHPRKGGIIAINLREEDQLIGVSITDGQQIVMLCTSGGKATRFVEQEVRPTGRTAGGMRGVRMQPGQQVISLIIGNQGDVLTVSENGFGKRTPIEQFPVRGRGASGVKSIRTSERNGRQVGAVRVDAGAEIMLITDGGTLVRTGTDQISQVSRDTQGVNLISLSKDEKLIGIATLPALLEEEQGGDTESPELISNRNSD